MQTSLSCKIQNGWETGDCISKSTLFYSGGGTPRYEMVSDTRHSAVISFVIISEQICYWGIKGKHHSTNFIKIHILLQNEQMKYGINLMKKLS